MKKAEEILIKHLDDHGLTEQFANVIFVQTAKRRNSEVIINKVLRQNKC